jgi:hypothetical protein
MGKKGCICLKNLVLAYEVSLHLQRSEVIENTYELDYLTLERSHELLDNLELFSPAATSRW